jgi:hypothetical protein
LALSPRPVVDADNPRRGRSINSGSLPQASQQRGTAGRDSELLRQARATPIRPKPA